MDYVSMIQQDPDATKTLLDIGQNALATGQISVADAKKTAKNLGMKDIPSDDYLTKAAKSATSQYDFGPPPPQGSTPSQAGASPLAMGGAPTPLPLGNMQAPNPGGVKAGQKGAVVKSELTGKTTTGDKNTQNTYMSADQLGPLVDQLRNLPEQQAQSQGINDMKAQAAKISSMADPDGSTWIKPFLGLVDAQTGSQFQKNYQPGGLTPEQRATLLQKYQENIQKGQGDQAKALLDGITKLKTGTDQTNQNNLITQMLANNQNNASGNGALATARTDALRLRVGQDFDKDSMLKSIGNTTNSLTRATSMMNGETPVTGKNFALLQQDMINAMAPGGAASEGKVNREMVETLQSQLNNIQQKFGNVKDLRKEQPEVFAQLQGLINQVQTDFNHAGQQRVQELLLNSRQMDDAGARKTAEDKADKLMTKYNGSAQAPAPAAIPDGRVTVKNAQGQIGHIPKSQLADALASGYSEVK